MGVYATDLIVETIPLQLPKLGIVISIVTPLAEPFEKLVVKIQCNKTQLLVSEDLAMGSGNAKNFIDDNFDPAIEGKLYPKFAVCELEVLLAPHQIDEEQNIRVIADTEAGELVSRVLRIRRA